MKITENKQTGLKKDYNIVVPAADVNKKYEEKIGKLASEAKLQGFRPGKVPVSVLKARFGASVLSEVLEDMLGESINALYEEKKIRPAMQPSVEVISFDEGKDLEFSIKLEILPDVPAIDFTKITVKKPFAETDDKKVEAELANLAAAKRETKKITEDRPAKKGDIAVIDFIGSVDGKEFAGGKGNAYPLELGSGAFIPGFEEQLIGKKVKEEVVVNVGFPAEYQAKELAGKQAQFKVKIKELREAVKTELNDELAKSFGKKDLAELKDALKQEITAAYDNITQSHLKRGILDALADACKFEVPEGMKNAEFEAIWKQAADESKAKGETLADSDKQEYMDITERRIRLGLILTEIGKEHKIQPSSADINRALIAEARRFPGQEKALFEYYQKNKTFRESINSSVFEDKVVTFISEKIKLEPVKVSEDELYSFYDDADDKPAKPKKAAKSEKSEKTEKADKTEKSATAKAKKGKENK